MKSRIGIAAALAAPVLAGAGAAPTVQAVMGMVPPLPVTAEQAYGQWIDQDGQLKDGPPFTRLEQAIRDAQANAPSANAAQANAQALAQRYATPQGQAEIQNMTMAQKMALAQQMAAQMNPTAGRPTAVSEHDRALMEKINPYPGMQDVRAKLQQLSTQLAQAIEQWRKDDQAIDVQQSAAIAKLKACPGEAGEPSDVAVRDVMRSFVPKHTALAQTYLARFAPLYAQAKQTVAPEASYADAAVASWNQIDNPALKPQATPGAATSYGSAIGDIAQLNAFVAEPSRMAADTIAKKNAMERRYANARGC